MFFTGWDIEDILWLAETPQRIKKQAIKKKGI
jgi:hypothetical protein